MLFPGTGSNTTLDQKQESLLHHVLVRCRAMRKFAIENIRMFDNLKSVLCRDMLIFGKDNAKKEVEIPKVNYGELKSQCHYDVLQKFRRQCSQR